MKFYLPVLWLSFTFLAACVQIKDAMDYAHIGPIAAKPAKTYVFECPDGYAFTASIEGTTAWLFLPEQTIKLPHVFSASGAKFSARQTTLWTKGNEARLEIDSKTHIACKNNHAKAIWEQAKLNGVDFRAIGNEPSWILEIVKGETIIFAYFYDKIIKNMFTKIELEVDQSARKTVYKAKNEWHTISVTIVGTLCQDTMSGESFESRVTVELDDKLFNGCGKALH